MMERFMGRGLRAVAIATVILATGGLLTACAPAAPAKPAAADVAPAVALDPAIGPMMVRACYPCHSDARRDPWFAKMAPSSWALDGARKVLDFSQWDRYDSEQRTSAVAMIADAVARGSMPPVDYTFFNHGARLDQRDRQAVATWAAAAH